MRCVQLSIVAFILIYACDHADPQEPAPRRVVAVTANRESKESLAEFCDITQKDNPKVRLTMPEVDSPIPALGKQSLWINVWATWCKPCIEEIPMLIKWKARLESEGVLFTLLFVSVDQTVEEIDDFRKKKPWFPSSLRLKDPALLASWIIQLGLDKGAGLPIHIFADSNGYIRCVRAAAINEQSYATILGLLK